jgi:hypothetical protein
MVKGDISGMVPKERSHTVSALLVCASIQRLGENAPLKSEIMRIVPRIHHLIGTPTEGTVVD